MSKICKQRAEENNVILFIFKGVNFTICNIQFDPHKSVPRTTIKVPLFLLYPLHNCSPLKAERQI